MRVARIKESDISNGPGIRISIFVSGCTIKCPHCFNADIQDFSYGDLVDDGYIDSIIELIKRKNLDVTILGGEPFDQGEGLLPLLHHIKTRTDATIWIYSGHTYEQLMTDPINKQILSKCEVLVDGPFIMDKANLSLQYRGSENQRIIDLYKSTDDTIVLYDFKDYEIKKVD